MQYSLNKNLKQEKLVSVLKLITILGCMLFFTNASSQVNLIKTNPTSISSNDGEVIALISAPPGTYSFTYYWTDVSSGNIISTVSNTTSLSDTLSAISGGTYVFNVIELNLGINSKDTVFLSANGGSFSYSGSLDLCLNPTTQLTAVLNGCPSSNTSLGIDYLLSNILGGVLLDTNLSSYNLVLPPLVAGDYILSSTNLDNGCITTDTFTINSATLSTNISTINVLSSSNLGQAIITASGGTPPYSIFWASGGNGTVLPSWSNGDTIKNLSAGTYNYTIVSSGCLASGSVSIFNACDAIFYNNYDDCDSSINLSARMNMTTPGNYNYNFQLSDNSGVIESLSSTNDSVSFNTNLSNNGFYYLSVSETSTGCVSNDTIEVNLNPFLVNITTTNVTDPVQCNGSVLATPQTGTFPFTFEWKNTSGATLSGPNIAFTSSLSNLCSDTFCLIATSGSCTYSECVKVDFSPCEASVSVFDSINCNSGTGVIKIDVDTIGFSSGGQFYTGPRYIYNVINLTSGVSFSQPSNLTSFIFPNISAAEYKVIVEDKSWGSFCVADTILVTQPNPLQLFTSKTDPTSPNQQNGSIKIDSIIGGTPPYSITWLDSVGNLLPQQSVLVQNSLAYSNSFNGGYTIQVSDTNSCEVSEIIYLNPTNPSSLFGIDSTQGTNPTCYGSCDGKLFAKMFDVGIHSVPPFTFYWMNKLTGDTLKVDSLGSAWYNPSHVATYTNRCPGEYELHAYDFYNNGPVIYRGPKFILNEPTEIVITNPFPNPVMVQCGNDTILSNDVNGGNLTNDTILVRQETINIGNPNIPSIFGFSDTLIVGGNYLLEVSGTYTDQNGVNYDAAYENFINPSQNIDWSFDGNFTHRPDPDGFKSNHVYYFPFTGDGIHEIIFFNLNQNFTGSLTFKIYELNINTTIYNYKWEELSLLGPILISDSSTALVNPGVNGKTILFTVSDHKGCTDTDTSIVKWDLNILKFSDISTVSASCFGDSSGSIVLQVDSTLGFSPFQFYIDGIASNDTIVDLPRGTYTLSISDSIGCISDDTIISILQPDSLYACSDGQLKRQVFLDSFIMTFDSIFNYSTSFNSVFGLEYLIEVSGTFGDTLFVNYMDAAYVTNQSQPIAHLNNPWHVDGNNNIRPIVDLYNPQSIYNYNFSGTGSEIEFSYEDPNNDYIGASGQLEFKIYKLACPLKDTAYACFGDSTAFSSISVNGGFPFDPDGINSSGDEFYSYLWTDVSGTVWSTQQTANNLPAGNYSITVTDSLGCNFERKLLVLQPVRPLNIDTIIKTDVACKGDSSGEIFAVVSGGFNSSTAVLMLGLDTIFVQKNVIDTIRINNLSTANYDFYVFDSVPGNSFNNSSCPEQAQILIGEPQNYLSSTVNLLEHVICYGDSSGKAISNVQGGQFPYIYAWDNGDSTQISSTLWAGWHYVTLTDANNCSLIDSIEIINVNQEIQGTVTIIQDVSCFNGCDGIAQLYSTGGVLQHTYFWDNGQTYFGSGPDTASNLCFGGHDIIIEDLEGCRKTIQFNIEQPTELFAQATIIQPVQCFGFDDGIAFGTATGGTPPYTYVWDSINGQSGQNANNLTPGVHVLYVSDSKGCTAQDTVVITEPDELNVSIDDTMTIYSYCSGTSSGQLCAIANGGTTPYNYVWNDPLGQQGSCAYNLQADFYTVVVMDDRNCIATTSFDLDSITNSMTSAGIITSQRNISCFGLYDGSISINTITGGVPGYTYQWTGPSGYSSTDSSISSLYAGSYACVITDTNGCAVNINTELYQPDQLEYNTYNVVDASCFGACNGQIWVDIEGGTWPYYYDLSESGIFPFATVNKIQLISDTLIKDLCTGLHSIYITDANNCIGTVQWGGTWEEFVDSGVVVVNNLVNTKDASCSNTNDGYAWIPWPGPNSMFTYTWETDPITNTIDTGSSTNLLFPGNYNLVAHYSDSANFGQIYSGCDVPLSFTILAPSAILAGESIDNVKCYGDTNGIINLSPSGGTGSYSFKWDTTTSVLSTNQVNNQNLINLQPGTYTVTISDVNGCELTKDFDVFEPEAITNDFVSVSDVSCFNLQDASATSQVDGGTPGYIYSWKDSLGNVISNSAVTGSILGAGNYDLEITDNNGCKAYFTINIAQPEKIIASTEINSFYGEDQSSNPFHISCIGSSDGSAIVTNGGGVSPITYNWTDISGNTVSTSSNTGNILSAGKYIVTVTDVNGCTEIDEVNLVEPTQLATNGVKSGDLSIFPSSFDISCKGLSDGWIELNPTGGVPNNGGIYQYSWSGNINGPTNIQSLYNLSAGNYSVTITDANGCSVTDNFTLDEPLDIFDAEVNFVNYTGPQVAPYAVLFEDSTTTVNNDDVNHFWYWSSNTPVDEYFNSNLRSFEYTFNTVGDNFIYVIVQNVNTGCEDSLTFNVEVQGIDDPINNVFTPNNDGINDTYDFGEHAMRIFIVDIYNRWGEIVYSWEGENQKWDGKGFDGNILPEGVYFYVLEGEGIDGEFYSKKGTVTLIR